MSGLFVGVDIGGSGMRVRVRDSDGDATSKSRDQGPLARTEGRIDIAALVARIRRLLIPLVGEERFIDRIAVGLTGMPGLFDEHTLLAEAIASSGGVGTVVVASDALTTHIGSLQGAPGAVVAAGTGVIALGTDHSGIWDQADGWGYLLGDLGGGAWVGSRGLDLALRARDGRRGGSPALLELALDRFGSTDELVRTIYGSEAPAHEVAAFAPSVAAAARAGDTAARSIWAEAGRSLATSAIAAAERLPPVISWGGRLFSVGDLLLDPFRDELTRLRPGVVILPPAGQAADGALLLAGSAFESDGGDGRYMRSFTFTRRPL